MKNSRFRQLVCNQLDQIMNKATRSLQNTCDAIYLAEKIQKELGSTKRQLDEARDQIFKLVSDRDRPFQFEIGQKVTLNEVPGSVHTITGRRHSMRPGGSWLDGYNEYQLFNGLANGLFWEPEYDLEPIVPAKKKSSKPKSK